MSNINIPFNIDSLPVFRQDLIPINFTGVCKVTISVPNNAYKVCWMTKGKLDRLDGPAVVYADGTETWYQNGKVHRLTGPAHINHVLNRRNETVVTKSYYVEGKQYDAWAFWRHYLVQIAKLDHILRVLDC